MLGERGILAFSPELGSNKKETEEFLIAKDLIADVLQENYKVVDLFLEQGVFSINQLDYGLSQKNFFYGSFTNKSFV